MEKVLPEEVIQHIQYFMTGKEAARSSVLAKSWYAAWVTRPTIDLDVEDHFIYPFSKWRQLFDKLSKRTMQRYINLSFKVESLRLRGGVGNDNYLIANALKMGATDLQLELHLCSTLPEEVLGSKTLLRLSVAQCEINGDYMIRCSRLKSLSLKHVRIRNMKRFKDITTSCSGSLEELSLTKCYFSILRLRDLYELHKLRRLHLYGVGVDSSFFMGFASRFPSLKDLGIHYCIGYTKIHIASASLQILSFKPCRNAESYREEFNVPNIQKFVYSGDGNLPFTINGAPKECELDIHIYNDLYYGTWFINLKRRLTKFSLSRISLSINILDYGRRLISESLISGFEADAGTEVEAEPILVENLNIEAHCSLHCDYILLRLFGICRPKLVTHDYWRTDTCQEEGLMHRPDRHNMFRKFGLKKVNMEIYEYGNLRGV